ncbi:hypothetical protein TNCV_1740381 [Trichonephila clavipes]|uniref:Uncharacterized protein n=1 Tax=Trichonephila clavipes TaxID=2585209 RepID=A0A8X6V2D8_TRICX|nr:hypothetical protein TNCV_1740381 [Trichonephila clavipes]
MLSSSLTHGSKLRDPSPKFIVLLHSVTQIKRPWQPSSQGCGFDYGPEGCCSPAVKVSDHGRHVMSSSSVPLKTRRVEQRFTLNLSRAETSSRWCSVVVRRGDDSSGVSHVA